MRCQEVNLSLSGICTKHLELRTSCLLTNIVTVMSSLTTSICFLVSYLLIFSLIFSAGSTIAVSCLASKVGITVIWNINFWEIWNITFENILIVLYNFTLERSWNQMIIVTLGDKKLKKSFQYTPEFWIPTFRLIVIDYKLTDMLYIRPLRFT